MELSNEDLVDLSDALHVYLDWWCKGVARERLPNPHDLLERVDKEIKERKQKREPSK